MKRLPLYATASAALLTMLSACDSAKAQSTSKTETSESAPSMEAAAKLKQNGDLVGAARIYEAIARESSTDVDAEIELAAIDRKLNKPADAVDVLRDAAKRQPDNDKVQSQLGYALINARAYEDAVVVFDKILQKNPQDLSSYNGKGVAFDKAGNHLAAQEVYKQALGLAPATLSVQNNMAMSFILNNQLGQAIALLGKLHEENPENKTIRHNLALAYGLNGDNTMATKLNKDLTPEQAKENQKYYSYYASMRRDVQNSDTKGAMQVGFSETPAEDKVIAAKPVAKKRKVAAKKPKANPIDVPLEATAAKPADVPPVKEEPAKTNPIDVPLKAEPTEHEKELQREIAHELEKTPLKEKAVEPTPAATEPAAALNPSAGSEDVLGTQLPTSSGGNSEFPSQGRR